jgi:hypothetical protein
MNFRILTTLLLVATALPAAAEVVRSVDKEGNVTFSDQPVKGSVESSNIKIDAPAPSGKELTESQQEAQDIIHKANQIPSTSPDKKQAATTAEKNLGSAMAELEAAKVVGEGDRKGTASGGSRLTPEYLERVKDAEENVAKAQKQLDKAKLNR